MRSLLITFIFFAVLAGIVAWLENGNPTRFEGRARVLDGDTILLGGEKLRLAGIDAPEMSQICVLSGADWRCGEASKQALRDLIGRMEIYCVGQGRDQYDRWLATCHTDGQNINVWLVKQGWAVDYGGYAGEEGEARRNRVGLWRSTFDYPQDWRRLNRSDASAPPQDMQSWYSRITAWFE